MVERDEGVEFGLHADFRREMEWRARAPLSLAEITSEGHRYQGRIGQILGVTHEMFVSGEPLHRVYPLDWSGARPEPGFIVKIGLVLVTVPEEGCSVIEKGSIRPGQIEVVDSEGRVGSLISWRPVQGFAGRRGVYVADFDGVFVEKEDALMMQEPDWSFRRAGFSVPIEGVFRLVS